jgi:serine phosphatase RsbU (regulator of sigma subunit)
VSELSGSSGLPLRTPIGAIADVAFDRIAGLVRTVLGVPGGRVSPAAARGQVFPGAAGLPAPYDRTRSTPLTHSFCQYVVRTAQPLIVPDARADPLLRDNLAVRDIGVTAYAGIPLLDLDGCVVGSLCAIDTEPRQWTAAEIGLLTDLAATCQAELQLRAAATAASDAQDRTSALLALSETLSTTMSTADISVAVSKLGVDRLGASFGGITVLDADRKVLSYVDLSALPPSITEPYSSFPLVSPTPSATALATDRALYFGDLDDLRAGYSRVADILDEAGTGACAYLPLRVGEQPLGTLSLIWNAPRSFDVADRALLDGLARYTAQAVARALLLAEQRQVAETLQTSLLPYLPELDWVELAARYLPAHTANAVGGDWFDAFALRDGSLVISVGDVQGHDIDAAAAMGQLRSTLRSLVIGVPGSPAQVLCSVDTVLAHLPVGRFATGLLATLTGLDAGARFAWSNAGHLPPLLLTPDSPAEYLWTSPERPLGLVLPGSPDPIRSLHTVDLTPGSQLLLFTDGLVDRREHSVDDLLEDLRQSAERHRGRRLPELIAQVLADMGATRHDDDIVVLGLRVPA